MLAEAVEMAAWVGRKAQSLSVEGRMRIDSYCVGAAGLGELVKKAMLSVGKPW